MLLGFSLSLNQTLNVLVINHHLCAEACQSSTTLRIHCWVMLHYIHFPQSIIGKLCQILKCTHHFVHVRACFDDGDCTTPRT